MHHLLEGLTLAAVLGFAAFTGCESEEAGDDGTGAASSSSAAQSSAAPASGTPASSSSSGTIHATTTQIASRVRTRTAIAPSVWKRRSAIQASA